MPLELLEEAYGLTDRPLARRAARTVALVLGSHPDKERAMCRRVNCPGCGKPTYAGCGAHVERVLGDVPKAERCRCSEKAPGPAAKSLVARLVSALKA